MDKNVASMLSAEKHLFPHLLGGEFFLVPRPNGQGVLEFANAKDNTKCIAQGEQGRPWALEK